MSGTDAFTDNTHTPSLDIEVRKEIQRLRTLLLFPNDVHLVTRQVVATKTRAALVETQRWLSDRYVMVNVTDSAALRITDESEYAVPGHPQDFPDGGYKLMASKGFTPKPDAFLPDTAGLLNSIERSGNWELLHRTEWSMADSDAKLMLAYTKELYKHAPALNKVEPVAVNEGIWDAFITAFKDDTAEPVLFEYCPDRPYRVSHAGRIVGYIASAEFPDKTMREDAQRVAEVVANR